MKFRSIIIRYKYKWPYVFKYCNKKEYKYIFIKENIFYQIIT